jgi:hypothetical protein
MEGTQDRLNFFRSRLLHRYRHPCQGRFDSSWDIETEFNSDCAQYNIYINKMARETPESDIDFHSYLSGLSFELYDIHLEVVQKWNSQDEAIEKTRLKKAGFVPPAKLDPSQTTLF